MRAIASRFLLPGCMALISMLAGGCGGVVGNPSESSPTTTTPASGSNVQAISVNTGPAATLGLPYVDGVFTSVTVCLPGSTTSCQTIGGILVDTGSSGLRILSSALTVSLPAQTNSSGNPVAECAPFASGTTWGPVATADVTVGGEKASAMPIQVIGSAAFPNIPNDCQGVPEDDLADLGANGFLGVGQSIQDCGADCTSSGPFSEGAYYACPSSTECTDTTESLALQVQNPVASFATDNNGVIVELPPVSGAEEAVSGSLVFGIGTESNNALGGATVFGTDPGGYFNTTYASAEYPAIVDSGSNGIYFLDSSATGLPECNEVYFWYCPSTTQTISIVNSAQAGTNGASGSASFTVGNAIALTNNVNDAAVNGLAGPSPGLFDLGLPFFFGRNVFVAISGKSTPGGAGPYTAY